MKALVYVEIDLLVCSLTYGVSPCTATLEGPTPTGTRKCFNTRNTCQDLANFSGETFTMRFVRETGYLPRQIAAIPNVTDLSFSPAQISLGKDLGSRASLSVTFRDHRWSDTTPGFDKYVTEREYDPFAQGTFWGKFRSRQPFLRSRSMRVIRGFLPDDIEANHLQGAPLPAGILDSQEVRHYVIETFDFDADGEFTITAKDVLKLADGDRAQAPRLSNGFLSANINNSTTSAALSPAGIGNLEYPASGLVAIGGKEIVSFTRSGDNLTITRAQHGTVAQAHTAQDRVQICISYTAVDAADIIADLFENYAGISSSFIPLDAWQLETGTFLNRVYTAVIAEPIAVNKLVSELIEQAALSVWWDDEAQQIRLRVLRAASTGAATFGAEDRIADSLQTREQFDKRISQVWTYFAKRNPLEGQEDADNYASVAATIDTDAETNHGSPAIHKIFSRWIPTGGRSVAERLNDIQLSRFSNPPRRFNLRRFRTTSPIPQLGTGYLLAAWSLQQDNGDQDLVPVQITRLDPAETEYRIEMEEMLGGASPEDLSNRLIVIDVSASNINLRTLHDALYPTPVPQSPPVTVRFIVQAGVTVNSTSLYVPCINVGDWDGTGAELTLEIVGKVRAPGGKGGNASANIASPGQSGQQGGGPALYTRYAIAIEGNGDIWAGGGGGGGGLGGGLQVGGGGGGAGTPPGAGGSAPAHPGAAGTETVGGAGRGTHPSSKGGDGGNPGQAGQAGNSAPELNPPGPGAGGAAGVAIDGDSLVDDTAWTGDLRGTRVN